LVIGFVPNHWALLAGILIQTAAQTTAHIVSKTLTDRYLLQANTTYFEPRGLKVRLMKTAAMRHFVGIDQSEQKEKGKFKGFLKGAEKVFFKLPIPIIGPIIGRTIMHFSDNPAPQIDPNDPHSITQRRIASLYPYIFPLSTDVPPPIPPESLMDKAAALQIKLRNSKQKKSELKAMRARQVLALSNGEAQATSLIMDDGIMSSRRARKDERKARKAASGRILARRRLEYKAAKADRLEMLATDGVLWIVLLTPEQDREIEGRELVDTDEDEDVGTDEWNEALEYENQEDAARLAAGCSDLENPYSHN